MIKVKINTLSKGNKESIFQDKYFRSETNFEIIGGKKNEKAKFL